MAVYPTACRIPHFQNWAVRACGAGGWQGWPWNITDPTDHNLRKLVPQVPPYLPSAAGTGHSNIQGAVQVA